MGSLPQISPRPNKPAPDRFATTRPGDEHGSVAGFRRSNHWTARVARCNAATRKEPDDMRVLLVMEGSNGYPRNRPSSSLICASSSAILTSLGLGMNTDSMASDDIFLRGVPA
jgi:hypothetical protein